MANFQLPLHACYVRDKEGRERELASECVYGKEEEEEEVVVVVRGKVTMKEEELFQSIPPLLLF